MLSLRVLKTVKEDILSWLRFHSSILLDFSLLFVQFKIDFSGSLSLLLLFYAAIFVADEGFEGLFCLHHFKQAILYTVSYIRLYLHV